MDEDHQQNEPHLTPEAYALRRRLSEQFDRAAHNFDESLEHARALVEVLKRDPRYQPVPASHLARIGLGNVNQEQASESEEGLAIARPEVDPRIEAGKQK